MFISYVSDTSEEDIHIFTPTESIRSLHSCCWDHWARQMRDARCGF